MSIKKYAIRSARAEELLPLRSAVLRNGAPPKDCVFDEDSLLGSIFLVAEDSATQEVVGIVSLHPVPFPKDPIDSDLRLRGMAVRTGERGANVGRRLVEDCITRGTTGGYTRIWCYARKVAIPFYEKCGFVAFGPEFEDPKHGPHVAMIYRLQPTD